MKATKARRADKDKMLSKERQRIKRLDPAYVEKERARSRAFSSIYQPRKTAKMKQWRDDLRRDLIAAYGGRCACCGETEPAFLTLDRVFDDGAHERRKLSGTNGRPRGGVWQYAELRKQGFPKDRHQLMCWNCNCGRARNGGICPHKAIRQDGLLVPSRPVELDGKTIWEADL